MNRIRLKLCSRRGESLAEVLVALLISVVAVALLAGMVGGSSRLIDRSTKLMQERYARSNAASSTTAAVTVSGSGTSFSVPVTDWQYNGSTIYYGPTVSGS